MKDWKVYLFSLIIVLILSLTQPSLADQEKFFKDTDTFHIGQRVTWLYKSRPNSKNIEKISGEVVKLGSKQIQIKVQTKDNQFVNRWVNPDKLSKLTH